MALISVPQSHAHGNFTPLHIGTCYDVESLLLGLLFVRANKLMYDSKREYFPVTLIEIV